MNQDSMENQEPAARTPRQIAKDRMRAEQQAAAIPGRGYRPPAWTPKTLPFPLERDFSNPSDVLACHWSDEHGGLYIGQSRYAKNFGKEKIRNHQRTYVAFVKPHKHGLLFVEKDSSRKGNFVKQVVIPGDLGLARTLDIIVNRTVPITMGPTKKDDKNEPVADEIEKHKRHAVNALRASLGVVAQKSKYKTRQREIAAAMIANGLWGKRGFVDPQREAPRKFWKIVPLREACSGSKRNVEAWWTDALVRAAREMIPRADLDAVGGRPPRRNMVGIRDRQVLINPIRKAMADGRLPRRPWDVRGWDKIRSDDLAIGTLLGLHHLEPWNEYVKIGAPSLGELRLFQRSIFISSDADGKIGIAIPTLDEERRESLTKRMIDAIERNKAKDRTEEDGPKPPSGNDLTFVTPEFAPPKGWRWETGAGSIVARAIVEEDRTKFSQRYALRHGALEPVRRTFAVAVLGEGRDRKEVAFEFLSEPQGMGGGTITGMWTAIEYKGCDLDDLREMAIFERVVIAAQKINAERYLPRIERSSQKAILPREAGPTDIEAIDVETRGMARTGGMER